MVACQKTSMNNTIVVNQVTAQNNNESANRTPSPSPTPEQEITFGSGWKLSSKSFEDVNHNLKYSIKGEYPQVHNSTDSRALKLNREIKRSIAKHNKDTIAPNPRDLSEHIQAFPGEDPLETAEFSYDIVLASDDLLSIRFSDETYSSGAAHPLMDFFTVNYDVKSGKLIEVGDIFKSGFDYRQFLSQVCIEKLRVLEPYKDAVSPKRKTFPTWNILSEGILISFGKCEIDACVGGTKTVIIPYKDFKEHLNPDNAVFRLAQ